MPRLVPRTSALEMQSTQSSIQGLSAMQWTKNLQGRKQEPLQQRCRLMEQYLCIAATFLADRYHGQEWPPCPARLFQALLAGACTGLYRQHWHRVEPALRNLECQPAPEMVARSPLTTSSYSIAVPNNDSDKAGREWAAGREFDPGKLRTMKTISPRRCHAANELDAHVYYVWPLSESLSVETVRQLTSFLHTFGWGIDMAYADSFVLTGQDRQALTARKG